MKILSVDQIRKADAYTIKNEPIPSIDLMERAARMCFRWIKKRSDRAQPFVIFCGPGNNGGDGLVLARLLLGAGYIVTVYILQFTDKKSEDFSINFKRLKEMGGASILDLASGDTLPKINEADLVIDAIFGSGLARPIQGFLAELIDHINKSGAISIAIDMPSGLMCDSNTSDEGAVIEADYTLSFQYPKLAFMFPENDKYVGEWHILPIGLMDEYTINVETNHFFVSDPAYFPWLKGRNKYAHKGNFGHALLISGSYGKMGAALMAAKATLRAGAGLVTAHIPKCGYSIIQTAVPECMLSVDKADKNFSEIPDLAPYTAIGTGPGLGTEAQSAKAIKLLIQNATTPILFDADAINILSENKTWLSFLPPNCIFTPHPKEFERLVGKSSNQFQRLQMQVEFSIKYNTYVVLKGRHTCVTTPKGKSFFNSTGNPGMATGGSGDVLTGIILGLLAQEYHPFEAAIMGVYLHGYAGDIAAKQMSEEAMIAGDITENLGRAFKKLIKRLS